MTIKSYSDANILFSALAFCLLCAWPLAAQQSDSASAASIAVVTSSDSTASAAPSDPWVKSPHPLDDKTLPAPGAQWQITCLDRGNNKQIIATLSAESGDKLSLTMQNRLSYQFLSEAALNRRIFHDAEKRQVVEFISGGGTLAGITNPRLDITYTVEQPVRFVGPREYPVPGGQLRMISRNEIDGGEDEATARYVIDDIVEIIYRGVTEIWRRQDYSL